ncbi:uncharacterized protein OCT59_012175 [Rhizophagus irregularis]|uniref:uncharacterized protein n=1 Tax=Rhizophagus irregularis TaxID=588596 RepID=UPI00332BADF3|nr:hypothetical protein OCT59_012175 [Rhizophagus irregularis]
MIEPNCSVYFRRIDEPRFVSTSFGGASEFRRTEKLRFVSSGVFRRTEKEDQDSFGWASEERKTQRFVRVGFRRTKTQRFVCGLPRIGKRRTKVRLASEDRRNQDS